MERIAVQGDHGERDWPDEPIIDADGWRRLSQLAMDSGMPSAAAACLATAGDWPGQRRWLNVPEDFGSRVDVIGERHGFGSLTKHRTFCTTIHFLVCTLPSNVETTEGVVRSEQGATSWRDLRRKMPGWLSRVERCQPAFLYVLALELHGDDTSFAAATVAGVRQRLTALVVRLETLIASGSDQAVVEARHEMADILEAMMGVVGPKGGRFSHGKRRKDCADMARKFWKEEFGRNPSVAFEPDPTTSPTSAFARWFCDIMDFIDGWTVSNCREVLRTRVIKG